jgi:hypothetical protein
MIQIPYASLALISARGQAFLGLRLPLAPRGDCF